MFPNVTEWLGKQQSSNPVEEAKEVPLESSHETSTPSSPQSPPSSHGSKFPTTKSPSSNSLSPTEPNDDDADEDVHAMLANLEIPDFDLESASDQEEDKPVDLQTIDGMKRLKRPELFSKRYHPSPSERLELKEVAGRLGVSEPSEDFFGIVSKTMGWMSQMSETAQTLLYGNHSVIITILDVEWDGEEAAIYCLTDGFFLGKKKQAPFSQQRYEACHMWSQLEGISRPSPFSVVLEMQNKTGRYELQEAESSKISEIAEQLERLVVAYFDLLGGVNHTCVGWQYQRVRRPGFSAAVTGHLDWMGKVSDANELDKYHKMAPLHYAVQQESISIQVVQALLRTGADPNMEDGDGKTAMYYAERNDAPDSVLDLMRVHGGQGSAWEKEARGELFGGVDVANERNEKRREIQRVVKENEAKAKADQAHSAMNKAMAALVERGEKIQEMDMKTQELNQEAKTFGDLAAQLKEKTKNKKWYQL
eukprot:Nitzschia sp. Nitz4//scaffold45_size130396//19993//21426//NITZ4_003432-RA/size130396-processed-gene-0.94-mRNA-1//-1//CDS//3329552347//7864//frame0